MNARLNVSSGPHVRGKLSTGIVMRDVCIALMPACIAGVWHFGLNALAVIVLCVLTSVATEAVFDMLTGREMTIRDGSAVVTGLLLALCLSPTVPAYIPILGSVFAILVVKCFFGGLGKNFMNPALAARCFLLISFSGTMTHYAYTDAVSSATPLAQLMNDEPVDLVALFFGSGQTTGVIGCSVFALLLGGLFLVVTKAFTWEIPVASIASFVLFIGIFGGHGFSPYHIAAHVLGGSIVMGAFFMATDPVTSPATRLGQLTYGAAVGILMGIFRFFAGSADSGSYAIIIANLLTPLLDEYVVAKPYAFRKQKSEDGAQKQFSPRMLGPALRLTVITLVAGVGLAGVFNLTKDAIEQQKLEKKLASYRLVLPTAQELEEDAALSASIADLDGAVYGEDFGKAYIKDAVVGRDAAGQIVGYALSVTSGDGYDGTISLSVGILSDGTVEGISFTELHETAGMGMRCADPEFKDQFSGRNVEAFVLNKAGGSTAQEEIDSVSGASISSGAVVNAVNAALDFFRANLM